MKKHSVITKLISLILVTLSIFTIACSSNLALAAGKGAIVYYRNEPKYFEDISQAWTYFASLNESAVFQLLGDWKADENGSFGEGVGFKDGAIALEEKMHAVIIDLNGYDVDRGLKEERENGSVFYFHGCKDISMSSQAKIKTSHIKGGYNKNNGGAFAVYGTPLNISNIEIAENKANKGGAFYIDECWVGRRCVLSTVTIYDTIMTENKAKTGGAVYIQDSNTIRLFDTTITKNSATNDAGIHTEVDGLYSTHIVLGGKIIIADNTAENDGTGLMLDENFFRKVSVSYLWGRPLTEGSRIVILSKTDDDTLRITADWENTYADYYEYENDSYKIVEKGSGNEKYLEIKKN